MRAIWPIVCLAEMGGLPAPVMFILNGREVVLLARIGRCLIYFQPCARDAAIGFEVALAAGIHHAGRQRRWRGVAVPAAGAALGVEIVTQRLFVEAGLRLAGLVDTGRPEARAVGGHHLVDQDDASV